MKGKSESTIRWLILLLTCVMMIGNYYCYDIPAALHSQLDEYMGKPDDFETMFSLLYTVYSVPNVVLPFFGGYFVDKWGARVCLIVFAMFITLGQFVFALGVSMKSWPIMFIGRVIFGFGGESMGVGNSAILSVWFKGKELAFSFGLNLSVARLGSVINNVISPTLADSVDIQFALWFGVVLCGASVAAAVMIASLDKGMDALLLNDKGAHGLLVNEEEDEAVDVSLRKDNTQTRSPLIENGDEPKPQAGKATQQEEAQWQQHPEEEEQKQPEFKEVLSLPHVFWIITAICVVVYGCVLPFNNIASALLLERNYFMDPPAGCQLTHPDQCQGPDNPPENCPSSKWYQPPLPEDVTLSNGEHYEPLEPSDIDCTDDFWKDGCAEEYCSRLTDAQLQAGTIMSIPYIISAVLSPVLGGVVDKFGLRAIIATAAPVVLVVVHALLGYTDVSPVGPLVGQGLAYCGFAAVIWPAVALVIEPRLVGLAYGTAFSIQNCGLASFPLLIAIIYSDNGDKYIPSVETFFVIVAAVGVVIGLYLNFYDYVYIKSILNFPATEDLRTTRQSHAGSMSALMNTGLITGDEDTKEHLVTSGNFEEEDNGRRSSAELYSNLH